ncbi:hypothetical protein PUN28_006396 [Cardiocondyla obscurior]|uniref:Uncharacterized protein n=1 Tax=Cardiocondyla obscurior TaxID=286306 RepID=A0AAW2G913_9HYME
MSFAFNCVHRYRRYRSSRAGGVRCIRSYIGPPHTCLLTRTGRNREGKKQERKKERKKKESIRLCRFPVSRNLSRSYIALLRAMLTFLTARSIPGCRPHKREFLKNFVRTLLFSALNKVGSL